MLYQCAATRSALIQLSLVILVLVEVWKRVVQRLCRFARVVHSLSTKSIVISNEERDLIAYDNAER